jgi:hypothetical protein
MAQVGRTRGGTGWIGTSEKPYHIGVDFSQRLHGSLVQVTDQVMKSDMVFGVLSGPSSRVALLGLAQGRPRNRFPSSQQAPDLIDDGTRQELQVIA